ncbi:MAG TPA: VOC family protein [Blastocatellia bacterium]|nr:VOC family protein [Blastocatellia bacterium]
MTKTNFGEVVWVVLNVKDFDAQRRFYSRISGYREIAAGDGWSHLQMSKYRVLELMQKGKKAPDNKKGFRPAFEVANIKAARAELISKGANPIGGIEGGPDFEGFWCAFEDPEGNYFEIKQVLHKTAGRAAVAQRTSKKKVSKKSRG